MFLLIISISIQAFFSPAGGARTAILKELSKAKEQIDVAMYILTDRELSNALVTAQERGVIVRVIFDGNQSRDITYSKHCFLDRKGIDVKLDESHTAKKGKYPGVMHHKFAIIDSEVLITGSYNWTHSAEIKNEENLLIIKGAKEIIKDYKKEFNKLWTRSSRFAKPIRLDPYNTRLLKKHIGEWVEIVGKPSNWNISRSGHLFIDFGKDGFTFLLWKEGVNELKKNNLDFSRLDSEVVKLTEKLIDHEKYGLEIVTDNPDAIQLK